MECFDMKIGKKGAENKTFWRTIGTVFFPDGVEDFVNGVKPFTFVIDYPPINGIIVPRKKKTEATPESETEGDIPF